jgi:hypothetical protein
MRFIVAHASSLLFLTLLLGSTASLAAAPIAVANAGFETPVPPFTGCGGAYIASDFITAPFGCSQAWTFHGPPGNAGITYSDGSDFANPVSPDGSKQAAFLQGSISFYQVITGITPGDIVTVSFYAAEGGCNSASILCTSPETVGVELDLTTTLQPFVQTFSGATSLNPTPGYVEYTTDPFIAGASSYRLDFFGAGGTGEGASASWAFIDEVSVSDTAAPEPGTLWTAGAGALLVLLTKRISGVAGLKLLGQTAATIH